MLYNKSRPETFPTAGKVVFLTHFLVHFVFFFLKNGSFLCFQWLIVAVSVPKLQIEALTFVEIRGKHKVLYDITFAGNTKKHVYLSTIFPKQHKSTEKSVMKGVGKVHWKMKSKPYNYGEQDTSKYINCIVKSPIDERQTAKEPQQHCQHLHATEENCVEEKQPSLEF
jgi:hypothetical protein